MCAHVCVCVSLSEHDEQIILRRERDEAEMEPPDNTNFHVRQRELCSFRGNNLPSVSSPNITQSDVAVPPEK